MKTIKCQDVKKLKRELEIFKKDCAVNRPDKKWVINVQENIAIEVVLRLLKDCI